MLSAREDSQSTAHCLSADDPGTRLRPLRDGGGQARNRVGFCTIHAFKGLEAPAVVVTDITSLVDEQRSLLYVAMSRARIRLVLLMRESCRDAYKQLFLKNLGSNSGRGS